MTRGSNERARQRPRQDGAIFVEALIVIGLIMVALQCSWGLYRFCLFQHRAKLEARAAAWESALEGCGESKLGGVLGALSDSNDGNDVGGMRDDSDRPPDWVQVQPANDGTVSLDLPAELFGRSHVAANQHFACNERGNHAPLQLIGADNARQGALDASSEQQAH
jgi:hypothetical protein